jgi:hypothetical protein
MDTSVVRRSGTLSLVCSALALLGCETGDVPQEGQDQGFSINLGPLVSVAIDWSVPKRTYPESDSCHQDLPGPYNHVNPSSWPVTLDGCGTTSKLFQLQSYRWRVTMHDGSVRDVPASPSCTADIDVPQLGDYKVELFVSTGGLSDVTGTRTITVKDYLIVSLGDSIASGEGNPDGHFGNGEPRWAMLRCHRSWKSGPARAAMRLEDADAHSSVTFVSVACSGAGLREGILDVYGGIESTWTDKFPTQIDQVVAALNLRGRQTRMIDAVLLQAGANDVGFGDLVTRCADPRTDPCYATSDWRGNIGQFVAGKLAELPGLYRQVQERMDQKLWYRRENVFIAEYPDPVHRTANVNDFCEIKFPDAGLGFIDGNISMAESQWAYGNVILPLRDRVQAAARDRGWKLVGNITDSFLGHGECASDPWFVHFRESWDNQQNEKGSLHPNGLGHQLYGDGIFGQLRSIMTDFGPQPPRPTARLDGNACQKAPPPLTDENRACLEQCFTRRDDCEATCGDDSANASCCRCRDTYRDCCLGCGAHNCGAPQPACRF